MQSRLIWRCSTWFFFISWDVPFVIQDLRPEPPREGPGLGGPGDRRGAGLPGPAGAPRRAGPVPGARCGTRRPLVVAGALCLVSIALLAALYAVHGIKDTELILVRGLRRAALRDDVQHAHHAVDVPAAVRAARRPDRRGVRAWPECRPRGLVSLALVAALSGAYSLLVSRCGAWTLSVMWESDRARETEARLAVAEERLRFGRDMHDVLGRNLAVIALKAELAVQLAQRGRPEAVAQMVEVQRIAQESQKEVREVVRGYREADLGVEIEGARGVLEAAGIGCDFSGPADGLPVEAQSALGWVVREATTNVLRHGDARAVAIRLALTERTATLVVENDGVPERPAGDPRLRPRGAARTPLGDRRHPGGGPGRRGPFPADRGGAPMTAGTGAARRRRASDPGCARRAARPGGRSGGGRRGRVRARGAGDGAGAPARCGGARSADAGRGRCDSRHIAAGRTAVLPDHDRDQPRPARPPQAGAGGGGARLRARRR